MKMLAAAIVVLAFCALASGQTTDARLRAAQGEVFRAATTAISPSIVRIETIGGALPVRQLPGDEGDTTAVAEFRQSDGPTTGVVWSADGYIVTSRFNFMRDPSIITVKMADGRSLLAKIVARDFVAGLALLKVNADRLPAPRVRVPREISRGQWAIAAGFGFGTDSPAMSVGIVSGIWRSSGLTIQTDAKISPANYGGPLFDIEGRLLGVCVPNAAQREDQESAGVEWYDSGIGFAVHCDAIAARVEHMKSKGDWHRGYLGIAIDEAEPVVSESERSGVLVEGAAEGGPAALAGLLEGDLIVKLNDDPTPTPTAFKRALARVPAGATAIVTIRRGAQELSVPMQLLTEAQVRIATSQPTSAPATQPAP